MSLASQGARMAHLSKDVVYMEMEQGSNLEPREQQKRTLYPLHQPHLAGTLRRALFRAKEFFVVLLNRYTIDGHEIQIFDTKWIFDRAQNIFFLPILFIFYYVNTYGAEEDIMSKKGTIQIAKTSCWS